MTRIFVKAALVAGMCGSIGAVATGCLSRPVTHQEPTTKTNFTAVVRQQAVDKLDILFMIDNSASMGDKQELLKLAVPDLIGRLVNPNCLDVTSGAVKGVSAAGVCPANQKPEFPAVHDMHIGVVSSSLGSAGADQCAADAKNPVTPTLNTHNDDQGHLLNRGGDAEVAVADEDGLNFLAWFPSVDANKGKPAPAVPAILDPAKLNTDFSDAVKGVHEYGCGFEAQLESWYRFLIQPDPYAQIAVDPANGNRRILQGNDDTILKQRAAFLRPDSLVAVILVTDENEEFVDPLTLGGQGWAFLNSSFPNSPTVGAPKGTAACATNPNSPDCNSCAFKPGDPGCTPAYYDTSKGEDSLNVRGVHMKQRFGIDPQFPIDRYVRGLTKTVVPNRAQEHVGGSSTYTGEQAAACTNPLYATGLPQDSSGGPDSLCKLKRGPRSTDLVFYAVIGGVPHQLLQQNPADVNSPQKDTITEADWEHIIGHDPLKYDFTNSDPHMLESTTPRPGLPPPTAGDTADPIHGREWNTNQNSDLQYACTFKLATPKDCTKPQFANACDCENNSTSPLCDTANKNLQIRGKAYPSIRELAVARALKDQAIVSSICPIHVDEQGAGDPLFGYRPAVKAIIDRLKNALANQCLPQPLTGDAQGNVPCLILETLGVEGDEKVCDDKAHGFSIPDPAVLKKFRDNQKAAAGPNDHPERFPVCVVTQLVGNDLVNGSCSASSASGWCYVTGAAAGTCPQAILFSPSGNPQVGSQISLQCIETQTGSGAPAPDAGP